MARMRRSRFGSKLEAFSERVTRWTGSNSGFGVALTIVVCWALLGPVFRFSDTWQLVINTGTTIVTFLMVFLIQQSQNKDSVAIHIKLNELLASHELASNRVVAVEDLDESDLAVLRDFYCEIAALAEKAGGVKESHSLDDAKHVHQRKAASRPKKAA